LGSETKVTTLLNNHRHRCCKDAYLWLKDVTKPVEWVSNVNGDPQKHRILLSYILDYFEDKVPHAYRIVSVTSTIKIIVRMKLISRDMATDSVEIIQKVLRHNGRLFIGQMVGECGNPDEDGKFLR
jgi:hypothetical protein